MKVKGRVLNPRRRRYLIVSGLIAVAIAAAGAVAATRSDDETSDLSTTSYARQLGVGYLSPEKERALKEAVPPATSEPGSDETSNRGHRIRGPVGSLMTTGIPAKMLGPKVQTPFPPELLRVRNGWMTADRRRLTAVYAGVAGNDDSRGRFVIFRQDFLYVKQTLNVVDVPGAGELRIIRAPLGAKVESWAQHGKLRFTSGTGVTGILHLKPDKVEIVP
jgi:hypothetical protein